MNNNFIGALIAILVSVLFAINLNNNNKKEPYAGGMPPLKKTVEKVKAFNPINNTDPAKVQWYSVSNFQQNPSPRGTNPEVGPQLRTQLNKPSRLSNDLRLSNNKIETFKQRENFENMVKENYSTYDGLPTVQSDYAAGNFNSLLNKDAIMTPMLPVGDMTQVVDENGVQGTLYNFDRFMYSNLKDNRNVRDADFIRGDIAIPPNKGSCWFGQRGYSLRPSALNIIGGSDNSNAKKLEAISSAGYRDLHSTFSAGMGDVTVENLTGSF